MANKNYELKNDYTENKEGGVKKKEYKKKKKPHYKPEKEFQIKKEEFTNEVDSDGFEIVGSREEKAQKQRDENKRGYIQRREWKHKNRNKNKKLEKHKKKDLKKSSSEKKIHSLLTNKLVKRYNSRINHFILDMVKKPLKVKEYLEKNNLKVKDIIAKDWREIL